MLKVESLSARILRDINFVLPDTNCLAIYGPSGSGKSTLLNAIAGNIEYQGDIIYNSQNLNQSPPWRRPFRYLNQQLYLFPYLTINGNLRLAQYAAGMQNNSETRRKILVDLEIEHLAQAYPGKISGGERQRAALARALISSPPLLLLDEPFSNLDWKLRIKLCKLIHKLRKNMLMSIVLVSHEPEEINILADHKIELYQGRIK